MNTFKEIIEYIGGLMYPSYNLYLGYGVDVEQMISINILNYDTLLCSLDSSAVDTEFENHEPHQRIYNLSLFALIDDENFMDIAFEANQNLLEIEN